SSTNSGRSVSTDVRNFDTDLPEFERPCAADTQEASDAGTSERPAARPGTGYFGRPSAFGSMFLISAEVSRPPRSSSTSFCSWAWTRAAAGRSTPWVSAPASASPTSLCMRAGEAGLEVVVRRGGLGHAGHRVPGAQRPRITRGHLRDVVEDLLIEAEPVSQHGPFDDALEADREHHGVDDLRGLTRGLTTGVEDIAGHRLVEGAGLGDVPVGSAEHEGQGARLGAADAPGDRAVDEAETGFDRLGVEDAGGVEVDRRGVDEEGLGVRMG